MNAKLMAAESIRAASKIFRGLIEAADELERVGSLENAAAEAQLACQQARQELDELKRAVSGARGQAEQILSSAEAQAVRIRDQAATESETEIARARQEAADAVAAGRRKLEELETRHQVRMAEERQLFETLQATTKAAEIEAAAAEARLEELRGKEAEARKLLADLVSRFA